MPAKEEMGQASLFQLCERSAHLASGGEAQLPGARKAGHLQNLRTSRRLFSTKDGRARP